MRKYPPWIFFTVYLALAEKESVLPGTPSQHAPLLPRTKRTLSPAASGAPPRALGWHEKQMSSLFFCYK